MKSGRGRSERDRLVYEPKLKPPWGAATIMSIDRYLRYRLTIGLECVLARRVNSRRSSVGLLLLLIREEFYGSASHREKWCGSNSLSMM
mgnify:CR=1 FL=1|jgi:hypothetical protein